MRTIISPAKNFSTVTKVQRTEPNLLPLVLDRELKDPVFYYKCPFGSIDINVLEHRSFISHGRTRQSNSFNLKTPLCRTSTFKLPTLIVLSLLSYGILSILLRHPVVSVVYNF